MVRSMVRHAAILQKNPTQLEISLHLHATNPNIINVNNMFFDVTARSLLKTI